ncbi:hypothetical protein D3C78_1362800 [compost metagenome]
MGDQYQGGTAFLVQLEQQVADTLAGVAVEVAGRLVGEQHRRFRGKGSGDGHALLLATRQLPWRVAQALTQADPFEQAAGMFAGVAATVQFQGQHDVFQGVKAVEQLERLEHEAHMFGTYPRALVFVQRAEVVACEGHRAGAGQVQAGKQAEQGRLARTRCPDNGQAVALFQFQ